MESGELSFFLKHFFTRLGYDESLIENVASHSLKASMLSMCAKHGVELPQRQLLGYHVVRGESSALNYGRDNLGAPLEALDKVLTDIRD